MKKILFVSALSAELKIVKQEVKNLQGELSWKDKRGSPGGNISKTNLEISFFECGMGNYKTILNLTRFLEKNKFDFIVNIWVCGYSFSPPTKGELEGGVIQIWRIKNLANEKELIVPYFFEFSKIGSIISSEKIIYDISKIWEENFVDMESYWFELVCNSFNIPRIILKVPVDKIWEETKNFDYKKAKKFLKENINYKKLIEKIEKFLNKTSSQPSPLEEKELMIKQKILNNYKWTFSEKIIIEKEVNRFIVLELWNLEEFFEENKELGKKEFLNKLKKLQW